MVASAERCLGGATVSAWLCRIEHTCGAALLSATGTCLQILDCSTAEYNAPFFFMDAVAQLRSLQHLALDEVYNGDMEVDFSNMQVR